MPVIVPAVTTKVAEVEPAATVTEAGVVSSELLSESVTKDPPAAAAAVRVTVQVLIAPEARLVGVQASEDKATVATRFTLAVLEAPLIVAVTVAV